MNKIQFPEMLTLRFSTNSISKIPKLALPKLSSLYVDENPLENVDGFVSSYNENQKLSYISFTLKFELSLEGK